VFLLDWGVPGEEDADMGLEDYVCDELDWAVRETLRASGADELTLIIGSTGNIGQANYAASKSGLSGLTKTLARETCFQLARAGKLSEDSIGLTVNAVAPGFIATEMLEHIPEKVLERIKAQIPVGRLGRPDEIARVVHFPASDHSSFITGAVLNVNGGQEM
jgi:NAD(P)-dependent dehydrogenase (short-subunit alcohol dehydrogenase family)